MKKRSFRERFSYWFDTRMSKGSMELVKLLTIATLIAVLLFSIVLLVTGLAEDGPLPAFWDSFSTIINAWMPSSEDGSPGYLIIMALAAIVGLLVTSVLIGIISSAIEEKIISLRRGNSRVLEKDHIVVVGFYPGEYTLLQQLILAAGKKPCCLVIAGDMERDEMEQYIRDNIEVPKNVRIICRNADIFDPATLEKCSLSEARSVIISPTDDERTVKALLSATRIVDGAENDQIRIGAIVSRGEYCFPPTLAARHNVTALQTNETLARIIAHSCTQPGLSATFREVFNFEGSEMYRIHLPQAAGLSFAELLARTDRAVPIGLFKDGKLTMFPAPETRVEEEDGILVFSEERDSALLAESRPEEEMPAMPASVPEAVGTIVIIGQNDSLRTVLDELPEDTQLVILAGTGDGAEILKEKDRWPGREIRIDRRDPDKPAELESLAAEAAHIVVLSDHQNDAESADMQSIFRILHLRDIRNRRGFPYNITSEMRLERNQILVAEGDDTDFIVASNMSSLFLAQLAENPELIEAFRELLSNKGNELYLKKARRQGCAGTHSVRALRQHLLSQDYIFLGYLKTKTNESVFNPGLTENVTLEEDDCVIVLGEK